MRLLPLKKPYFVLADPDKLGRVLGYGVYFTPDDQPTTNVQVDDGYFPCTNGGWKVALCAANALRDELNADPSAHPSTRRDGPVLREGVA